MAKRILILDDDELIRKMYINLLSNNGYEVFSSESYSGALDIVNQNEIDLVLLDLMLGGDRNGFDFLETLRRNPSKKDIKVIVLTNLDSEEKVARNIGVSGYLVKVNNRPNEVLNKIKKVLE